MYLRLKNRIQYTIIEKLEIHKISIGISKAHLIEKLEKNLLKVYIIFPLLR